MLTGSRMEGRAAMGLMVSTVPGTAEGMAKVIGSGSTTLSPSRSMLGTALAQRIASRKLPTPLSLVFVTIRLHNAAENSEVSVAVLDTRRVAVDETKRPAGSTPAKPGEVKLTFPVASVITSIDPRNVCPSPKPDGSRELLAKNSRRKFVPAVLLSR